MRNGRALLAVALLFLSLAAGIASAQLVGTGNLFSPKYGHPYRHGAVPTREAAARMREWATQQPSATTATLTVSYAGGTDSIGVTSGKPKVYLVVYGNQWGTAGVDANGNMTLTGDTIGAVPYLQQLFKGLGTGAELWSGVVTQYCDGPSVVAGATSCPPDAPHIGYPTGGAFAGIWYDNSAPTPAQATGNQLAQEAIAAAAHFGNTSAASNRYAQYVILSPTGAAPDGFNTASSNFCAWHDYNADTQLSGGAAASPYGDIAFTNMPYVFDAGASCGANLVNPGDKGRLDGVSLTEGHEYAETLTDPTLGGWYNQSGDLTFNDYEIADECDAISPDPGFNQNVVMGNGSYAMQTIWSNDTNACEIAHAIIFSDTVFANGFE